MSDEPIVEGSEQPEEEGQTSVEGSYQGPPQTDQAQQFITLDEFERRLREYDEKVDRRIQSRTDSAESRIKKAVDDRVGEQLKFLNAAGVTLSKEEEAAMRKQIAFDLSRQPQSQDGTQEGPPARPSAKELAFGAKIAQANAEAARLVEEHGFDLASGDPEFNGVNFQDPDPDHFVETFRQAITAKAQRLGRQPNTPPQQQQDAPAGSPQSRIAGNLGGGPAGANEEQLIRRYNELYQNPSQNFDELKRIAKQLGWE